MNKQVLRSDGSATLLDLNTVCKLYSDICDFRTQSRSLEHAQTTEYMLATIPRAGSTFFATELWRTGRLGAPMEYLNPVYVRMMADRRDFDKDNAIDYWEWVKARRTSPNGIFGYKAFPRNYIRISRKARDWLHLIGPDKVVFLTRRDLIEHAVSYSKAIRSHAWFSTVKPTQSPGYDRFHIATCLDSINFQMDFWKELFSLTGTDVCHLYYEDLLTDLNGSIARVADFIGIPLRASRPRGRPIIHVQRDADSAAWVRRFRNECSATTGAISVDLDRVFAGSWPIGGSGPIARAAWCFSSREG